MTGVTAFERRFIYRSKQGSRCGYTLVELVASVAATAILVAGMGSVVMVAARSTSVASLPARQMEASWALENMLGELGFAISLTERSATAIEFTVADRDGDTVVETIRYAWTGTPGDPLTRQYNGGAVVDFLDDVHVFEYSDLVETVTSYEGAVSYHVYQCDLALQVGSDAAARIDGSAKTFNAPEVAAP